MAACAGTPSPRIDTAGASGPVKIGKPYKIRGKWYYPEDERDYRETGSASWYGPNFHGKPTANGERFDQNALTAAHRTLPMPSWVRVENLDNGREVTVRINDRGPFAHNRIIDLSRRAAQLLGMENAGVARVRVTRVYPDGSRERAAPPPVLRSARGPQIQVAALSDPDRAARLSAELSNYGPVLSTMATGGLIRVRLGPFRDENAAERVLAQLRRAGYTEARIVTGPAS